MIDTLLGEPVVWLLGVIITIVIEEFLRRLFFKKEAPSATLTRHASSVGLGSISNIINVGSVSNSVEHNKSSEERDPHTDLQALKGRTHILVIDDEEFGQMENVKAMGWVNIRTIEDINDVDDANANWADIIFVDVQGVGKIYATKAGGVELIRALKNRYGKSKWLILYSANRRYGMEIFESGADAYLAKNARPIEIEKKILQGAEGLNL